MPTNGKGDSEQYQTIDIHEIRKHPVFENLLSIDKDLLQNITLDIRRNRFYPSQPVVLAHWPGLEGHVLIDGHARVRAAFDAGITRVPFVRMEFPDEMSALQHAMSLQAKRRTTTDGALYRLSEQYDRLMEPGRRSEAEKELPTRVGNYDGRSASARFTASLLGCNYKKVEKIRKIRKDGTPELQEAVKNDKMSINRAYELTRKMERGTAEAKPKATSPAAQTKAAQVLISEENLVGLHAMGGDLSSLINRAVEQFLSRFQDTERSEKEVANEVEEY